MAKKSVISVSDLISGVKDSLSVSNVQRKIPDIITFCEADEYLGFNKKRIRLKPVQKLILKVFYRGSVGNENISLTEEEIATCEALGLNDPERGTVLQKYHTDHTFRELVLVWGRRCLSEDATLIDPQDGNIYTFGELWDSGRKHIDSWTFDEDKNKMKRIEDAEIIYQGKREVFKLETMNGFAIEATSNHPFLTERGWVELKDIDVKKDKVAICEEQPFFGESDAINEDEAALLGYMTGDGNCSQSATNLTCDNQEILVDVTEKLNSISDNLKIFNDPWTKARSAYCQYKITSKRYEHYLMYSEKRGQRIAIRQKNDLMKLMVKWDLAGKTCHYKTVPTELFRCSKKVVASYLRALFSCDGHLGVRNACTIEFYSSNKQQVYLVQHLLLKFGIIASLRTKKVNSYIIDEKNQKRQYHTLTYGLYFSRKIYIERFFENIGFVGKDGAIHMAMQRLSNVNSNIKTTHNDRYPFSFFKIRNIERMGKKRTFDLSVSSQKSLQNFTSNGFMAHNSGKDFLSSTIALYEAMKLLECPGGDPRIYYNVAAADITILTVANSQGQASLAFDEIREKLLVSEYFKDKYIKEGIESLSIHLLTSKDKQDNITFEEKGLLKTKGSVVIEVGHSNSASLVGKGCFVLILDEVASYKNTEGPGSGSRIYASLTPTLATYFRQIPLFDDNKKPLLDENNKQMHETVLDGKIISISSPRGKEGQLWELFSEADLDDGRLVCRLPTWDIWPERTRKLLRDAHKSMSEEEFMMEFGAEFSGTAGENYFSEEHVKSAFRNNIRFREVGQPGHAYFVHLDPANTSHNYALAMVHREIYLNKETKQKDFVIIVDVLKYWHPTPNRPIISSEVDKYILGLKSRFRIAMITYDQWASSESILRLRKAGMPHKETRFTNRYKMAIYAELADLLNSGRLIIPHDGPASALLMEEMLDLQRKIIPTGYRIGPKRDGDGPKSDDICDAISGACYMAINRAANTLPQGKLVRTGISPQSDERMWQGMQGPMGYGRGNKVADALEQRRPYKLLENPIWPPRR